MLIRRTLLHVRDFLEKSTLANDAETDRLLAEVNEVIDRIDNDPETLGLRASNTNTVDSLAASRNNVAATGVAGVASGSSASLLTPPAGPLGTNLKTRSNARLNRSQTVVASSRPQNLSHLLGNTSSSRSPSTTSVNPQGSFIISSGDSTDGKGAGSPHFNESSAPNAHSAVLPSALTQGEDDNNNNDNDGGGDFFDDTPQEEAMPDDDVADWLNKNFADTHDEREETGFDLPLLRRQSTAGSLGTLRHSSSVDTAAAADKSPTNDSESSTTSPKNVTAAGVTSGRDKQNEAESSSSANDKDKDNNNKKEDEEELNKNSLQSETGPSTIQYSRSHERKSNARESARRTRKMLQEAGVEDLSNVIHSPDFDLFALLDEYKLACGGDQEAATRKLFVTVGCNVFFYYSFVLSLDFDVAKLVRWFHKTNELYGKNPYHNAIHAADVLQTTHVYLLTSSVYQFFSDPEIFAVLFGAASHDIGHLGTSNLFLQNVGHPTAVLYNDQSVQENFHTALAFHLLHAPGTDFLSSSTVWTDGLHRDFRSVVIDVIWGTDMKNHATLMSSASSILEDGVIEDSEVPSLLRAIVHAADLSNPLKQWSVYMEWAARVVAEFWRQGDEESKRGAKISPMCDRNGANFSKAQSGFISFVVRPWMKTLQPVLPPIWLERMEENLVAVNKMSQREIDDMHVRIATHAATPLDDTVAGRVMESLRQIVSPQNDGSLRCTASPTGDKKTQQQQQQQQQQLSPSSDVVNQSPVVIKPMSELTEPEIVERMRAQWSDIIKGLTSRGSLSHSTAIEQWSRILIEAHGAAPFLQLQGDSAIMKTLATANETGNVDSARAVLEKLKPGDFREPFSLVRTLNLTILDMTRPVIRAASPATLTQRPVSPYNLLPRGGGSSAARNLHSNSPTSSGSGGGQQTVLVDHEGNSNNVYHHHHHQRQQQPSNIYLSSENAGRGGVVRFFSEERPVVVPLEARYNIDSTTNNNNYGDDQQTPSRNLMTPQS